MPDGCIAAICPNVVDLLSVYLCTTYLSLLIKQQFHQNITGQVGAFACHHCLYFSVLNSSCNKCYF